MTFFLHNSEIYGYMIDPAWMTLNDNNVISFNVPSVSSVNGIPVGNTSPNTGAFGSVSSAAAPILKIVNTTNPDPANLLGYSVLSQDAGSLLANGNTQRPRLFQTTLSVGSGVTSTRIHENFFSSVYVTGAGTSGAEINQVHTYFENNATGPVTGDVEGFEASMLNNGTMATYMSGLMTPRNGAAGTISNIIGTKYQYANDSATAGSIGTVNHIDIEAKIGSGTTATVVNALRIADPKANIVTDGHMIIGGLAMPNAVDSFWIKGDDSLDSTFAMRVQNSSAQDLLWVTNAGNINMRNALKIGSAGSVAGSIFFSNATSGTIKIQPTTGALGSQVLTLPAATGIVATEDYVDAAVVASTSGVATFNTRTGAVTLSSSDVTTALTFTPYNATNPTGYQTAAQVKAGTTTNDNASPGQIGEYISSTVLVGSAVSLTSNTITNVTSISLSAGDWEVSGSVWLAIGTGGATLMQAGINNASATMPGAPSFGARAILPATATETISQAVILPMNPVRISLATTTTIYLLGFAVFPSGATSAYGFIGARRAR